MSKDTINNIENLSEYEIVFKDNKTVSELDMLANKILAYAESSSNSDEYSMLEISLNKLLEHYQKCEETCLRHTWTKRRGTV